MKLIFTLFLILPCIAIANPRIATVSNQAYFSVMDCDTRLPLAVIYKLSTDTANAKRYAKYIDDAQLKASHPECHPITDHRFKTYQSVLTARGLDVKYDVGHLAMSNHLDASDELSRLANQFSNLAPQVAKKNRRGGAWYHTEMQIECLRQTEPLIIVAGTIDDPLTSEKDYFVDTFGQTTPDEWYRLIYFTESNLYKAYIIPNTESSTRQKLQNGEFDVSLSQLDAALSIKLELIETLQQASAHEASSEFMSTDVGSRQLSCRSQTTSVS